MPRELIKINCRNKGGEREFVYLPVWDGEAIACDRLVGGVRLVSAHRVRFAAWHRWRLYPRGSGQTQMRIDFLWRLNLLLRAGVSLTEALGQLREAGNSRLINGCITGLLIDLHQGKNFAQALARMSWLFSPRILGLMRHAEKTGQLSGILDKLIASDEWMLSCTRKMLRALLYPGILMVIMCIIALVMLLFVMPNFAELLIDSGKMDLQQPPWWYTLSQWASLSQVWMGAAAIALPALVLLARTRHRLVRLLPATEKLHHSRQMHLFEFLYEAGIHLPDILVALGESETSRKDQRHYLRIADMLRQGHSLGESFTQAPILPPLVLTLLRAGEGCGRLGFAAGQAGLCLEREANELMKSFEQWLTPVCLLIMGGLMAWLFTSITGALYDFGQPL
ncbi:MAG: type II secretion system F family protein [Gammaproteobacteria bacterium]|nr:type II secretion system F family protein [Gammaproteobacteria bacterium]